MTHVAMATTFETVGYKSACITDISEILAPRMGFFGVGLLNDVRNTTTDIRCHIRQSVAA